jgi:hypothetical protein
MLDMRRTVTLAEAILTVWLCALQRHPGLQDLCQWDNWCTMEKVCIAITIGQVQGEVRRLARTQRRFVVNYYLQISPQGGFCFLLLFCVSSPYS